MDIKKISRGLMFTTIFLALAAAIISFVVPNIPGKTNITPAASSTWPTVSTTTTRHVSPQALIIQGAAAKELKDIAPMPNSVVKSPLTITGSARGTMFFEASFPIIVVDGNGKTLVQGHAEAQSDWMTSEFVPFKSVPLSWSETPSTEEGRIIFKRDNPSGLPEHDREAYMTVRFIAAPSPVLEGDVD
jgi:hypothetical protein